jgi:hypothetical protein
MVPILRLSVRWHATGTSFVIYLEIDTRSVISPKLKLSHSHAFVLVLILLRKVDR